MLTGIEVIKTLFPQSGYPGLSESFGSIMWCSVPSIYLRAQKRMLILCVYVVVTHKGLPYSGVSVKFLIAELKSGQFLTATNRHTTIKNDALTFDTEDKALKYCRKFGLAANHVPVRVPKEHVKQAAK